MQTPFRYECYHNCKSFYSTKKQKEERREDHAKKRGKIVLPYGYRIVMWTFDTTCTFCFKKPFWRKKNRNNVFLRGNKTYWHQFNKLISYLLFCLFSYSLGAINYLLDLNISLDIENLSLFSYFWLHTIIRLYFLE